MFRNVMNDLATWYETGADKIAVVRGGKFVGKTWAVADFAMGFFEDHIIIDMDKYPDFAAYAAKERRPEKLHAKLTTSLDKYDIILTAGFVSLRHPVDQSRERKSARMTYAYMR